MARVWIEDRATQADYVAALAKWKASKSKRKPPGRWRVRWYDPDGGPKAKTFQKLPQAESYVQDTTERLDKGSYRDPAAGKALFEAVAAEWFDALQKPGRTTMRDYRQLLDLYVLPKWGTYQVAGIKWEDVSAWLAELRRTPGVGGRLLSPARVVKIYRVFSMVMKRAVKSGRIAASPAIEHDLPRIADDDEHVYLSHEQVEKLAEAADEYRAFMRLLASTGIRWGEAIAITVGQLDLVRKRIRITRAYSDVGGVLEVGRVKTHENRSVPIMASLVDDLKKVIGKRKRTELVFTAPGGGPLRYNNFRSRVFDPSVKAAGFGDLGVTPHKLRHTAASLAIAAGADVKVVQTMLGHKTATMTLDLYGHLWPDRLDEVSDALEAKRELMLARRATLTRFAGLLTGLVERRRIEDTSDAPAAPRASAA